MAHRNIRYIPVANSISLIAFWLVFTNQIGANILWRKIISLSCITCVIIGPFTSTLILISLSFLTIFISELLINWLWLLITNLNYYTTILFNENLNSWISLFLKKWIKYNIYLERILIFIYLFISKNDIFENILFESLSFEKY